VGAEHVAQGRGVDAFRVRALLRLFELLGVAQEDDAACRVRGREDVARGQAFACLKAGFALGEGHLGGLVDEQEMDGVAVRV
jgi:hypothetical protein